MKLYIKTPFYDNNKYLPHLLEHCVCFSFERDALFTYFADVEWGTTYGYTDFEFYTPLSLSNIIHKITQPVSKETFFFQKKIIADELREASYSQKLREKFNQILEGNVHIRANNVPKGITLALLTEYQKKWYQEKHMLAVWEDNQIDFGFWKWKKLKSLKGKWDIKRMGIQHMTYKGDKYSLLFCRYHNASDILFLDFFEWFVTDFLFWKQTQEKKYFRDDIDITLTDSYFFLSAYEVAFPKVIDEDFFVFYKNRYLEKLSHKQLRGFIPPIALYTEEYATVEEHQNFVKTITYQDIQMMLDTIIC